MHPEADISLQKQFLRCSRYLIITVGMIGLLVIAGWQFNIEIFKRPLPLQVGMNPLTALLFIVSALAYWKFRQLGSIVILAGVLKLIDVLTTWNIPVDRFLFAGKLAGFSKDAAGSMAPNTAICFILSGIALLLLNNKNRKARMPVQYVSICIALGCFFALLGYLYNVEAFYGLLDYHPMAMYTAICFILLSAAFLFAQPGEGLMKLLTGKLSGGVTVRLLVPVVVLVPVVLGLLRFHGHRAGYFTTEPGVAILVLCIVIIFLVIIFYIAVLLNKRDMQRLEMEEKIKQNTKLLENISERITDGFIALDKNFCYTYVNQKTAAIINRKPGNLIGKNVWEEFPQAIGSPTYDAFLLAMKEQRYMVNTDYYAPLDLWQENHIYPSANGLSVFIRDISKGKKTEKDLETAHDRLSFHIKNSPLAFIEWDEQIKPKSWSGKAAEIFGWTEPEALSGQLNWFSQVHEEDQQWVSGVADQLVKGKVESNSVQHRNYTRDGGVIWCEWFNSVLKDEEGKVITILSLVRDISEQKQTEKALHDMEQEILRQKIQEQKKITRAIITAQEKERTRLGQELHDNVNQLLASTRLHLSMAGNDDAVKALVSFPIELIDHSIEEIRALSSRLVTPLKDIDLRELIRSMLDKLMDSTALKTHFAYQLPAGLIDDDLKLTIYRILQEQINNIIKYAEAAAIFISIRADNKSLHVVIADDGKGFHVNKKRKGIGISNMMNRIESFNGEMMIESSPGNGCKIAVTIPF